jgi:seryl-tRNA synthetase
LGRDECALETFVHDLKAITSDPEAFITRSLGRVDAQRVKQIAELHSGAKTHLRIVEEAAANIKHLSRQIGPLMRDPVANAEQIAELKSQVAGFKDAEVRSAAHHEKLEEAAQAAALALPNLPAPDVPFGVGEEDNVQTAIWGDLPVIANPLDHVAIGERLGMDFEQTVKMSGSRYVTLRGSLARLERVLGQFMLDTHVANGWEEVTPPHIVKPDAMLGTGQLPKFGHDMFHTGETDLWTEDTRFLIPTAEVSLTNLVRETLMDAEPQHRMVALTPCYRREAGSSGRDTKGMIRLHQFNKVELVSVVAAEHSEAEHIHMLEAAEGILRLLGLPFRRILLCSGDMGFSARKTFDLEVWVPSQDTYREISSISNCGDFQARRMDARCRRGSRSDPHRKGTDFVHTLNGSGVAVGRALVAILENYQEPDGNVRIPGVLQDRLGGAELLTPEGFK